MTIKEIIQRIQALYSKGVKSDDSRLNSRHIYSKLKTIRGRLLYERVNKRQFIASINYQVLPCVELVVAPITECPCIPPLGCCIYKTKYPLPKPLSGMNGHIIRSVTSLDGNIVYSELTWQDKKYKQYDKYTSTKPDYFITGEYLYVTAKNDTEVIRIEILLEDPIDGYNYPMYCPTVDDCVSIFDKEFHLDNSMVDAVVELSVQELISIFNQAQEDSSNNSKDNPEQTTK
jgi:hypothetical protein